MPSEPYELAELERRREDLHREPSRVGDFRAGSLNEVRRKCEKLHCACAVPGHPGHGPKYNLTRRVEGRIRARHLRRGRNWRRSGGRWLITGGSGDLVGQVMDSN